MQEITRLNGRSITNGEMAVFSVLLLVDSLHFVFARALVPHMHGAVSAMYVMAIATLEVGIYGLVTRQLTVHLNVLRSHLLFFVIIGFLVGASTAINYVAVAYIDAGTASMLGKTSILFSLAFGIFFLHERLNRKQLSGAVVSMLGLLIISFQPGDYLRFGSVLVVVATLMYALHTAVVKRYGEEIGFVDFFFLRLLATTVFLVLFSGVSGQLVLPGGQVWTLLFLAATVDVVVSRTLYYLALRRITMSMHTIILMISPVLAVGWSIVIFSEYPLPQQLVGGIAVVAGVSIAMLFRS